MSIYRAKEFFCMETETLLRKDLAPDDLSDMKCCGNNLICGARMKTYWFYNLVAAALHLLNAILMFVTYYANGQKDVCYTLRMSYAAWDGVNGTARADDDFTIRTEYVESSRRSLHWLIFGFHSLSFVFQFVPVLLDSETDDSFFRWLPCRRIKKSSPYHYPYQKLVREGRNPIRFFEYAISASIMLVCIALLSGVRDENILIMIAMLCGACQMFGYVAESVPQGMVRIVAHVTGWVTLMTSYAVIWAYYGIANFKAHERWVDGGKVGTRLGAPAYVHAIVITMFLLFNSFGVVQLAQMYCKPGRFLCCKGNVVSEWFYTWVGKEAELSYVALSLIAKTVLGWVIYFQVIVMARKCV